MSSKEALERILMLARPCDYEVREHRNNYCDMLENVIKKDLDQLEEYRKTEKEISVDFITLVKILKDDVYINDGGIVNEIGNIYKEQVKSIEHWPVWGFTVGDDEVKTFYAFRDRGKTWALSKEEFYENIK